MTKYKIEKNVPMGHAKTTYPFADMEVGDSFRVEIDERKKAASAANMHGSRFNMKFSVRKHEGVYRCWRKS